MLPLSPDGWGKRQFSTLQEFAGARAVNGSGINGQDDGPPQCNLEPCHRQSAASRSVMEGRYSGVCVHVRASRQAMQKASWKAVFHLPDVPAGMMTP